jgi:hypothetical protein
MQMSDIRDGVKLAQERGLFCHNDEKDEALKAIEVLTKNIDEISEKTSEFIAGLPNFIRTEKTSVNLAITKALDMLKNTLHRRGSHFY